MKIKPEQKKIIIPDGHKLPVTRRDFLKYGVLPFAGQLLVPSLLTQILNLTITRSARAEGGMAAIPYIPFLVFDMAGGGALPGNFLVGKQGGPEDLLNTYETLGWNPRAANALDKSFGLPMARDQSQLLAGMKQAASAEALLNLRMGSFCNFSQDDTSSNQTSALTLISRAGLRGRFSQNGVGAKNSLSGGNSDVALKETQYKPLFVQDALDIQGSVSHGPAFADFSDDQIKGLSRVISEMSSEQIQMITGRKSNDALSKLTGKSYGGTQKYGKTIQDLDARQDTNASQIYQLNQNSNSKSESQVFASIAHNVIQGNTGPGAITIGGFDYHNQPQAQTDAKDREMGVQIGRAVELAYRLKKPLFFQLLTDGGVSATPGTRNWVADSNVRSMTIIGYYNPKAAPEQRRLQVGEYDGAGETVNQENALVGGGADIAPSRVADAVLANYLSACGRIGEYEKAGRGIFRNADLDSVLIF